MDRAATLKLQAQDELAILIGSTPVSTTRIMGMTAGKAPYPYRRGNLWEQVDG